jgi:phosphate transport system substrate-binding protein
MTRQTTKGEIDVRLRKTGVLLLLCALLVLGVTACGGGSSSSSSSGGSKAAAEEGGGTETASASTEGLSGTISGAGSTFAQPIISQWGSELQEQGLTVNYNSIGSGGGVAQFQENTVDFGDSDAAMTDEEVQVAEKNGTPVHVPIVLGAVTVSYNLPGVETGLKLDGATVAEIFLGKITEWNDPAIAKLNPGVELPETAITVYHRSDSSGTTALFTEFLSDYSPEWKSKLGEGDTVKWPTGTGANGNEGVAGGVSQTEGAIGYVELAYALQNEFTFADVQNKAGKFIEPSLESTSAAGEDVKFPPDLRFSMINASSSAAAYPIASTTFVLVYEDLCKAGKSEETAKNVVGFLDYALSPEGQASAEKLDYAPLAPELREASQAKVEGLKCNGKPISAG